MWQQQQQQQSGQQSGQQLPGTQQHLLHFHPVTMNFSAVSAVDVNAPGVNLSGRVAGAVPQPHRSASNPINNVARGQRRHQHAGMPGDERRHPNTIEEERCSVNGTTGTPRHRRSGDNVILGPQRMDSNLSRSLDDSGSTGAPEYSVEDKRVVRRSTPVSLAPEFNADDKKVARASTPGSLEPDSIVDDKNSVHRSSCAKPGVRTKGEFASESGADDGKVDTPPASIPERTDKEIIASIASIFEAFTQARKIEDAVVNNVTATLEVARKRRDYVNDRLAEMRDRYADGKSEYEKTVQRLAVFRGDPDILKCMPVEEIEKVCESLDTAKEAATVATALYNTTEHPEKKPYKDEPMISEKEKMSFEVQQLPEDTRPGERTDDLIGKLIAELTELRHRETKNIKDFQEGFTQVAQVQAEHEQLIYAFQNQVESVRDIEKKQREASTELALVSGNGDLESLTLAELKAHGANIGKYIRKVNLALAMQMHQLAYNGKEDMKQTTVVNKLENDPNCIVCYERKWNTTLSPCGHVLCDLCASRLKYCATCRTPIAARQRTYVQ